MHAPPGDLGSFFILAEKGLETSGIALGLIDTLQGVTFGRTDFLISLISFNVGVELGQITVIAAALMLSRLVPVSPDSYRRFIAVPASLVIGVIGIGIAAERVIGVWLS